MNRFDLRAILRRLWPVLIFIGLASIGIVLGGALFEKLSMEFQSAYVGAMLGLFMLNGMLAGSLGRTWLGGLFGGIALAVLGFALTMLGATINMSLQIGWSRVNLQNLSANFLELLTMACVVPTITLALAMPVLAMRQLYGWRLTLSDSNEIPRTRAGLEDLLHLSVIVASFLMLARLQSLLRIERGIENLSFTFMASLVCVGYSTTQILPALWSTFRVQSWRLRLPFWAAQCVLTYAGQLAFIWFVDRNQFYTACWLSLFGVAGTATMMSLAMIVLRQCGVHMTRFQRYESTEQAIDPFAVDESLPTPTEDSETRSQRRWLRVATASVFLTALVVNGILMARQSLEIQALEKSDEEARAWRADGVNLTFRNNEIVGVQFEPTATDQTMKKILKCEKLESISLVGTQITDAAVEQLRFFPLLNRVDLAGTNVSDAALKAIPLSVKSLSIARTKLSKPAIVDFLRSRTTMNALDIGNLQLNDQDVGEIVGSLVDCRQLCLKGNPISNACLANLRDGYSMLDLSDTEIDGSSLRPTLAMKLVLDGTKIKDADLTALCQTALTLPIAATTPMGMPFTPVVQHFSIKNTQITANCLSALPAGTSLSIVGSQITEMDLESGGPMVFHRLGLNGPAFDGSCFRNPSIKVAIVDLSHSALNDQSIVNLTKLSQVNHFDFSHTSLTDAALPSIGQLQAYEINLRHTRITGEALLESPYLQNHRIIVSRTMFKPESIVKARSKPFIAIDEESMYAD